MAELHADDEEVDGPLDVVGPCVIVAAILPDVVCGVCLDVFVGFVVEVVIFESDFDLYSGTEIDLLVILGVERDPAVRSVRPPADEPPGGSTGTRPRDVDVVTGTGSVSCAASIVGSIGNRSQWPSV